MSTFGAIVAAAILLAVGGCATDGDAATGGGSSSGSPDDAATTCPADTTLRPLLVAASAPGSSCIDLDADVALDVCEGAGSTLGGFVCFEDGDGRRVWLYAANDTVTPRDTTSWTRCAEPAPPLPPPCTLAVCPQPEPTFRAPSTTCTTADTREAFRCGAAGSPYDAACCPLTLCDGEGACPAGFTCTSAGHQSAFACARTEDGCECAGTPDAATVDVCTPAR